MIGLRELRMPHFRRLTSLLLLVILLLTAPFFALAQVFPPEIDLADLLSANGGDGSRGMVLNGVAEGDKSGFSVYGAGDFNGDGIDDFLVGANFADSNGKDSTGQAYIIFGDAGGFPPELELSDLLADNGGDGTKGLVLNGISEFDRSGFSVAGVGDVNGDGLADIIIGAILADPSGVENSGQTYLVFGRTTFTSELNLVDLLEVNGGDGTQGVVLNGIARTDQLGASVSRVGDVNGDGFTDFIVYANGADPNGNFSGQTYLVWGRSTFPAEINLADLLASNGGNGSEGVVLNGSVAESSSLTNAISGAGDFNGDGFDDVLIAAPGADPNGNQNSGQTYIVFGRTTTGFSTEMNLEDLLVSNGGDGTKGVVLNGIAPFDQSGSSVSSAGDVNGDGFADVLIGADLADANGNQNSGQTYVFFGRSIFPAEVNLVDLMTTNGGDGSEGVIINGAKESDLSGSSVSGAGDFNGDGFDDFLIGAIFADSSSSDLNTGKTYWVFGRSTFPAEVNLADFMATNGGDGSQGIVINGVSSLDTSGGSVAGIGDANGDGLSDILIGAHLADPNGESSGQAYVVFGPGPDTTPPAITPTIIGTLGENEWYTSDVMVTWEIVEDESIISSSTGCDPSTVDFDTFFEIITCEATSGGGTTSQSVGIQRDATSPSVTLISPPDGVTFLVNEQVLASWSASDATGLIFPVNATTFDGVPIDTSTPGAKVFSVTATDVAGNVTTVSHTYMVEAFTCDTNQDFVVDRSDIISIFSSRNLPAMGEDDPRDRDGDGTITIIDGRLCVLECTNPGCAPGQPQ